MNMRDYLTLHSDINQSKKQLVVRNVMNENEHERPFRFTMRYKLK